MENGEADLRLGSSNRRLDATAIQQGVRKECPFRPGLFVMVLPAASYNPRYRKALQNARAKLDAGEQTEFLSKYDSPEFVTEAFVADMDGLYDREGKPVPYTPERGLKILSAAQNADVLEWIANDAHAYGQFYTEAVEADAGN